MQKLKECRFFNLKATKFLSLFFFPFFVCFITEIGHMQSLNAFASFVTDSFGVIIFDVILICTVFWFLTFLCKSSWICGLITVVLFFAGSCVEYYKYYISGSHFIFTDLAMTKNVGDMAQFTRIHFNTVLFVCFLLIVAYIFLLYLCDVKIEQKFIIRSSVSVFIGVLTVLFISVPTLFSGMCTAFGIDASYSFNAFSYKQRFDSNNFISTFTFSLNQTITSKVETPQNYSEELVNSMLESPKNLPVSGKNVKPNIIFIMSESFGDFRNLNGMEVSADIYKNFDKIKKNAFVGKTVVPTFGGNTVRTEFELMFGLPVKSLNNSAIPHSLLPNTMLFSDIEFDTFALMYKSQGYHTTYLHPFSSSFYDREDAYSKYGFDKLIFIDDLSVPVNFHRNYVDDDTLYRETEKLMTSTKGPDYIYMTTMQNHQPYGDSSEDEVSIYLSGIKKTCDDLLSFLERLKSSKEPCVVFFVGDHLPFFSPENNLYSDLGITVKNCQVLYDQDYIIWNNYNHQKTELPDYTVSAFYLPHIIYNYSGLVPNEFNSTILSVMKDYPVYSVPYSEENSFLLDTLTYDRTLGNGYSDEEIVKPFI